MCGIVGLYLKTPALRPQLGRLFAPMLIEMTDRGPDSAGIALYNDCVGEGRVKIVAFHPDADFDWSVIAQKLREDENADVEMRSCDTHQVFITDACPKRARALIEDADSLVQVMSVGSVIEIYKEKGLPEEVIDRFLIFEASGTHAIGHTRMATESAVTTAGSHPFSTGLDLCLVHNGSLSNHNRLREDLCSNKGIRIRTQNDTEVAAAYMTNCLNEGLTLRETFQACLANLDGFYTFVAGTAAGFAVLRDPIACKPAVLAETEDYVAFGSEYRALVRLPGIKQAEVWEPEPATVYSWGV